MSKVVDWDLNSGLFRKEILDHFSILFWLPLMPSSICSKPLKTWLLPQSGTPFPTILTVLFSPALARAAQLHTFSTFILKHLGHSEFLRKCKRPMETSKDSFWNANLFMWWLIMFCSRTAHISFGYLFFYYPNFCIHGLFPDQVFQTRFYVSLYPTIDQLGCNINAVDNIRRSTKTT